MQNMAGWLAGCLTHDGGLDKSGSLILPIFLRVPAPRTKAQSGASAPDHLVKEVISSIQEKFDTSLVYDTTKKETIEFKVPLALR